jgi:UDP-N-acetylglucosamine diphosphorylase / glucose-1-phosphate thymidylyltransferase / UDP-N-acetylgalactosamine diphosphorylase / glucosamine-1-phosphate N-acetyltransferase / galactosamine-1-phosphate N-acetyltransferase
MTRAIVFDDGKGLLAPLTDLRAAFDVRTGALTTLERLAAVWNLPAEPRELRVPDHHAALTRERHPGASVNQPLASTDADYLLLSGRWARCTAPRDLALGQALVEPITGDLVAARVRAGDVDAVLAGQVRERRVSVTTSGTSRELLARAWHARSDRDACLAFDLAHLLSREHAAGADLYVDPTATVHPSAIFDTAAGPVFIDEHAVVRPGAILVGPVYVGRKSTVLERATIRPSTALGPSCKVAGEVGGTIFQGFSNKAHDGYLGDSWLGEWVNLGAGTTNSNLLNTYAEVVCRATPASSNERTGETFLGCVLGDHVKTAICTRIMTGSIAHTGVMHAATTAMSGTLGAFAWVTDATPAPGKPFRLDKFLEVAKAVMARRSVQPSAAYAAALARLHDGAHR